MLFKLLLPYLRFNWDSLDLCELASKEVIFPCIRAHPWDIIFPLIALIYTDILRFCARPFPSVVGIIYLAPVPILTRLWEIRLLQAHSRRCSPVASRLVRCSAPSL